MSNDFEFDTPAETRMKRGAGTASGTRPSPAALTKAKLPKETVEAEPAGDEGPHEEAPEKPKYDPLELAKIFDEIIFSGEYSEDVTIRGKLKVKLRTRNAEEIEQISLLVDATTANLVSTLAEKRAILNLQYALTVYQGKDLRGMSTEDKAKFVKRIPGPVIGTLLSALNEFDAKVYAACQDGETNF